MQQDQSELQEFIRLHRNNESNFHVLLKKLEQKINEGNKSNITQLQEIKNKQAEEYTTAKQKSGNAWPEFENFVTAFERALL